MFTCACHPLCIGYADNMILMIIINRELYTVDIIDIMYLNVLYIYITIIIIIIYIYIYTHHYDYHTYGNPSNQLLSGVQNRLQLKMTQGSRWGLWHQPLLCWTQWTHGFWPDGLHQWFRPAYWLHFFGLEWNWNDTRYHNEMIQTHPHVRRKGGKACAGRNGSNDCLKMFEASNLVPWFSTDSV